MSQPDRAALVAKVTEMVQRWDDIAAFDAEEGNIQSGEAYEQCVTELRDVLSLLSAEPERPETLDAFKAGFQAAMDGTDRYGDWHGGSVEEEFRDWVKGAEPERRPQEGQ